MIYSARKTSVDYDKTTGSQGYTTRDQGTDALELDYIELPLMVSLQPGRRISIHLGAGPVLALGADETIEGTVTNTSPGSTSTNHYRAVSSSTTGLASVSLDGVIGVAYDLPIGLHFGVRYIMDVTDIHTSNFITAHEGVLQLSVGYCFMGKPE